MNLLGGRRARRASRRRARERSAQRLSALAERQWDLVLDDVVQGRLILEVVNWPPECNGWIFWHIIWADGTTNYPGAEDYGPDWPSLEEVEAGTFEEPVITEILPSPIGHEQVCHDQVFALREVPRESHVPLDLRAQARRRRATAWRPTR